MSAVPALDVRGLRVVHGHGASRAESVQGVDLHLAAGEVLAIVGESGSGKSTICRALLGLVGPDGHVAADRLAIGGDDLARASERRWRTARGRAVVLVPQHASRSLSPTVGVGRQVERFLGRDALARYADDLRHLGLEAVLERPGDLPDRFSGGQLHRLVLALATLGRRPALIVADEPTGSLDAAIARTTIALLDARRAELGAGMVLVTHDLGLAAEVADRVAVLHDGVVVEEGPTAAVLGSPTHPRTRALVAARPGLVTTSVVSAAVPVVAGRNLYRYHGGERVVRAVDDVTIEVGAGELVAVVGASGSGKSTLGRLLCGAEAPTAGDLELDGERIDRTGARRLVDAVQLVVQDPRGALNPARRVGHALVQAQRARGQGADRAERRRLAEEALASVGLAPELLGRRPCTLSGGEVARVAIARALLARPRALVLDEPTGALDREVQVQVLATIDRLRRASGIAVVLITHDLEVAASADRVVVLDAGQVVDAGAPAHVLAAPSHAATAALVAGAFAGR
ncbi:MAG: ABC transporter ATP-binding protein [Acidimicrobiales bacterium]|nr:ABC transporter ATP-binding protein [Acidimicrobiales bacterium]HRW36169.1 ATP-binding cassette domain-containing protein [Aquihabitans sp.]